MEKFNPENLIERPNENLTLNDKLLQRDMAAVPVLDILDDCHKIFVIVNQIKTQNVKTIEEFRSISQNLFNTMGVENLNTNNVFPIEIIQKIIEHHGTFENLEVKVNFYNFIINSTTNPNDLFDEYKNPKKPSDEEKSLKLEENKKNQEKTDAILKELDSIDFAKADALMTWLQKYNDTLVIGVDNHKQEIIKIFGQHGYAPENNDYMEFLIGETMLDRERYGKAVIGFGLQNLGVFRNELRKALEDWRNMN